MSQEHTIEYRFAVEELDAVVAIHGKAFDLHVFIDLTIGQHPGLKDDFADISTQLPDFRVDMPGLSR